ncbi:hypothetical protein KDN24_06950 [Bacillus sp. Bva_UNVM-123]|uniref:3D domain-containing protein n=1 Tax=Bacillus sp. Bva_UNVM-123 TaxID=2829798 RepID=UPI00391F56A8
MVSRGSSNVKRTLYVTATAYTSFCKEGCIGKTSLGIDVSKDITYNGMRIIAADRAIIKPKSIVRVYTRDETFIAYVADTGSAIVGNKIDVLVSVRNEKVAFDFGKQKNVKVEILREGE